MTLHLLISMIVIGGDGSKTPESMWVMFMVVCAYACGIYQGDKVMVGISTAGFIFSLIMWTFN